MNTVIINKNAKKQLAKIPQHIRTKLQAWATRVELLGITKVREIKGFHDKPLFSDRQGQRSIRLSKAYRAFYIEHDDKIIIEVIEVNKHDY